ncbi:MAG: serpin family protein [Phycisphaerae bacterium]
MNTRTLLVALALIAAIGCGGNAEEPADTTQGQSQEAEPDEQNGPADQSADVTPQDQPADSPEPLPAEPEPTEPSAVEPATDDAEEVTVANATNAFAVDMYQRLAEQADGNIFFSPTSIHTALSMTYAGARGETATEMEDVLHIPGAAIHADYAEFITELNDPATVRVPERIDGRTEWTERPAYQLHVANALWPQAGYPFEEAYVQLVRDQYKAVLEQLDYSQPEAARQRINEWVEEKTNERIKDLLARGVVDRDTVLVLTNAIYFKSNWAEQFSEHATADGEFHVSADQTVTAEMMNQIDHFGYAETDRLQVLSMPYEANELDMVVILPREVDGLDDVESELSRGKLDQWLGMLRPQRVHVTLPKWEFTSEFSLAEMLSAMGMPTAFTGNADFSGMTTAEKLFISAVIHKAFVAVDEKGTEAAAATAVVMARAAAPTEEPKVFRADRPFMFLIRHRSSGAVLFMGRVTNPAGASAQASEGSS